MSVKTTIEKKEDISQCDLEVLQALSVIDDKALPDEIDKILRNIPKNNALLKANVVKILSEKTTYKTRQLNARYKEIQESKIQNYIEIELSKEALIKYAIDDKIDIGGIDGIKEIIPYDYGNIIDTNKGLFYFDKRMMFHETLQKPIDIVSKTIDVNLNNLELYSFYFGDSFYRNLSLKEILKQLETKTLKYSEIGRDVLKKYFEHQSSKELFKTLKPGYVLGWDNGWHLPITEDIRNETIITHTAIQEIIYQNSKEIVKKYSEIEKSEIFKKLKEFIEITQTNHDKLAIVIGWSIAAPFKLYFIKNFQLFVLDYLCGLRETGKTHLALFYVIHFYKIHKIYFSETILNNPSQLEDYMASSTFPILFSEFTEIYRNIIDKIKETCTGVSNMIKKLPNQGLKVNKPKTAAIMLDSNEPVEGIDNAMNTKMNFLNFAIEDTIKSDDRWVELFNELKEKYLFSFIYKHTKDWDNQNLDEIMNSLKDKYQKEYLIAQKEDSRLGKTLLSIMFGIDLFEKVFDIELNKDKILDVLIQGRTYISNDLLECFRNYCGLLVQYADVKKEYEFDLDMAQSDEHPHSIPNPLRDFPHYMKFGLTFNKNDELIFGGPHLLGFNQSEKSKYKLKQLYNLLKDSLKNKSLITYDEKSKYSIDLKMSCKAIVIKKVFIKNRG